MKHLPIKFTLFLSILFFSNAILSQNYSRKQYIDIYKDIAIRQMNAYGIPASIILAQGCLESGNGNSRLAVKGNNHFGIKCSGGWNGRRIYHDDDKRGECFRRYTEAEDSYKDHSEFLKNGKRYQSLFDLGKTDYKAWAHGLKAAGYATNPKYAKLLIDIVEENQLYLYDSNSSAQNIRKLDKEARKLRRKELREAKRAERLRVKAEKKAAKRGAKMAAAMGIAVVTVPVATTAATTTPTTTAPTNTATPVMAPMTTPTNTQNTVTPPAITHDPNKPKEVIVDDIAKLTPLTNSKLYRGSMDRPLYEENGVPFLISTQGETYASIAKQYNLFTNELLAFNNLVKEQTLNSGTIVYIKKKKKSGKNSTYIVSVGESMYQIAQKLGIRLESLYELNNMGPNTEAEPGKILNLQK